MRVYMDNNATTPLHPAVIREITETLALYGNPSSMHEFGRMMHARLVKARRNIADFFGMPEDDMLITSCGSESNNTVLKSLLFPEGKKNRHPHLITSAIEHPAILETAKFLAKHGVEVTFLPVDSRGLVDPKSVERELRTETELVSVMYANNEIGTIEPIEEIGRLCWKRGIRFHTDAVQAAGKIPMRISELPVDFASFSGHKLYAPKGIGILYARDFKKNRFWLTPLIHGGHQEHGFRAGTENTLGILALGKICEIMQGEIDAEIKKTVELRDYFEQELVKIIPDIFINGTGAPRLPGTSNVTFKFIEGESILLRLDMKGIAVSTGSACSTGSLEPSHVIMALHHDPEMAHGSIRFSFGRENTREEVDYLLTVLKEQIPILRAISPLSPENDSGKGDCRNCHRSVDRQSDCGN